HSRALVLDEMAARHRSLRASTDPEAERLEADHRAAATRYATLLVRGPDDTHPERYRPLLDQARHEMEDAERQLAAKSASFRGEQRAGDVGLAEVAAALPPRSALIAFASCPARSAKDGARTPSYYLAYAMRCGIDSIAVVQLGAAGTMDSVIARW